jgi:hypothetical protein
MESGVKAALKKYHRMRSLRRTGTAIMAAGVISSPWLLDLGRTDSLICWLGGFVVWMTSELEMRLKTMQVRLATLDDQMNTLSGGERRDRGADDNLILELNHW